MEKELEQFQQEAQRLKEGRQGGALPFPEAHLLALGQPGPWSAPGPQRCSALQLGPVAHV